MINQGFFVTGGALQADAGCYVARVADKELLEALQRGEFCYVLTSRQMGKSSLMVRTAVQLREQGCAVVIIDLTAIGQNLDVDQWYFSMLCHVGEKLNLETEMEAFWDTNQRRAPLHRFIGAIKEVYLERKRKPLVIFVDEIDAVRSFQKFSADEFFAGIRECYNRRPEDPKLERLTFCLLGVATPSDLIRDERITPFNIGHPVELGDFTPADAIVLAGGLSPHHETARVLLDRVSWWTSGQPYLTQKLCAEIAQAKAHLPRDVDSACERIFLSPEARERDDNLHFVRDRLLRSEQDRAALLDTYAKVCRGERLADDHLNPVLNDLRLSGVVRVVDGHLQPRNRIYSKVFDLKWVQKNLPNAEIRRQRAAFYRGVRWVAGVAAIVLIVMGVLALYAWRSAQAEKAATESKRKADASLLREAGRTKVALDRLVETQTKIGGLLEALTPLVTEKSGKSVLERAEDVVQSATTSSSADDPRVVLGLVGLRRVCGRLYLRLGNDEAALKQAEQARQLLAEQMKLGNNDPAFTKQMHECILLVGDCILGGLSSGTVENKSEADYSRAMSTYHEAIDLAHKEFEQHPEDSQWMTIYFADLTRLGDTAGHFGTTRIKEAEDDYNYALRMVADARQRHRKAADLNRIEASIHDSLGSFYLDRGRRADARVEFDRSLKLRQSGATEALGEQPERQSDLATSYNKLGKFFEDQEKWKEALDYYDRALGIRRSLFEQDKRHESLRGLGQSLANVARVQWQMTWKDKNSAMIQRAVELSKERLKIAETLLEEDPSDPHTKPEHADALAGYADLLLNVSDPSVKDWNRALELAQDAVRETDRRDPRSLVVLAQALRFTKHPAEARQAAEEANTLLPPPGKRTSDERRIWYDINWELRKDRNAPTDVPVANQHAR
ncbi:MAG TPA: AAA-like domain-containing protein [Chthoniobacterales bacterium]|nr:AAA-like domain-containing protein [Chthoniobacterales bacterium]